MNEKIEIFIEHFKTGFLKASAFFAVWFIVYNPLMFLIRFPFRTITEQTTQAFISIPFILFYAV
ncbi:MAG: hypothetical protein LBI01_05570, partial [Elusimicrobium sp.]|nr:hypothetical protein [Elusimicrobium sp.]